MPKRVKWADTCGGELTEVRVFTPQQNHKRCNGSTYSPRTLCLDDVASERLDSQQERAAAVKIEKADDPGHSRDTEKGLCE